MFCSYSLDSMRSTGSDITSNSDAALGGGKGAAAPYHFQKKKKEEKRGKLRKNKKIITK